MTVIPTGPTPGYCNIDDVRALGITEEMASASLIETNIYRAAHEMDSYMGGSYKLHDVDVWLDGTGKALLFLPDYPVHVLLQVQVRKGDTLEDLQIFEPATGEGQVYLKNAQAGILQLVDGSVWPSGAGTVHIVYEAGIPDAEMPGALRAVNARMAAAMTLQAIEGDINPQGLQSIGEGGLSVSYGGHASKAQALMQGWQDALKPYKRVVHATI